MPVKSGLPVHCCAQLVWLLWAPLVTQAMPTSALTLHAQGLSCETGAQISLQALCLEDEGTLAATQALFFSLMWGQALAQNDFQKPFLMCDD